MRLPALAAALFCACISLPAQDDFRFSGYAVNFPAYQRTNAFLAELTGTDKNQFVDVTRLRLRPSLGLWTNAFLMVEYEFNATYVSAPLLLSAAAPSNRKQLVDLTWSAVSSARWNIIHYVDRAFVRQSSALGDFTIGRQRISWGTGRIWNPTDLFNPINPVSFSKLEKDGIDAVLAKFVFGNFTDLSLVYSPQDRFRRTEYGGRFRTNTNGFDVSVMGGFFDDRIVVGGDFAGSILDAGIRAEGILSGSKTRFTENYFKGIVGADNQFTEKLYAMVEYHFNGPGKSDPSSYDLGGLINGKVLNLGRHFAAGQVSYLVHPLLVVSAIYNHSFTDGSGFVAGTAIYSVSDEISLSLGGQYFFGDRFDEYWYYPSTIYGKVDLYF